MQVKPNDILMFFLELIMLFTFGYFGYQLGPISILKWGAAIASILLAAVVWGYWAAPKSKHRLTMPMLAVFRSSMFLLASAMWYWIGYPFPAVLLAFVAVINQLISLYDEGR